MVMRVVLVLLHGVTYVAAAVRAISRTRCRMGGSAMIVAGRACVCMSMIPVCDGRYGGGSRWHVE